jgi:hypothetical protein
MKAKDSLLFYWWQAGNNWDIDFFFRYGKMESPYYGIKEVTKKMALLIFSKEARSD